MSGKLMYLMVGILVSITYVSNYLHAENSYSVAANEEQEIAVEDSEDTSSEDDLSDAYINNENEDLDDEDYSTYE